MEPTDSRQLNSTMPESQTARAAALTAFNAGLINIDYPAGQIQSDYGYSNFLDDGRRQTVDLAAFGSAVPSIRTCNIAVSIESGVALERLPERLVRLRALGAPLLFAYDLRSTQITRWRMTSDGMPVPLDLSLRVPIERLPDYFLDKRRAWNPEAFRQARTAVFQQDAAQLDFLDLGLLPMLEGELQRKLSKQIQKIADQSRRSINEREGATAFERQFSGYARLLFRLLAARLLSDRGDIPMLTQNGDVADVLRTIERKYHAGEDAEPAFQDQVVQSQVWDALRQGIDLRNLSPETLAFVYENTLVDSDLRRRNGIHATPPQVADYLLRQLPIHLLPEAERVVFEPFCGNAPFLLAAMRCLRELLRPADRTPAEVHQYLVERLLGIEVLPFANEIARYSLILGDYPGDNHWQITEANAFTDPRFDDYLKQATVVLSNPPHEAFAPKERQTDAHPNRAAEALRRVLLHPPKMLGFVMPLSFVDGNAYKSLRRKLVETYPNLNVTAMPDNVFGRASQQTALIAAHRMYADKQYSMAAVSAQDYRTTFAVNGRPSFSEGLITLPVGLDGAPILYQRLQGKGEGLWEAMTDLPKLSDAAELHRGLRWTKLYSDAPSTSGAVLAQAREGFAPGVHRISNAIEDYLATQVSYLDIRPERKHKNALRQAWSQPKALVNAARISGNIWRLLALADTEGLYASQQHIGVWLRPESATSLTIEAISAVLNGPIANAFMFQRCRGRDNDISVLKQLPIPSFTSVQASEITSLVNDYKDMRWSHMDESVPWGGRLAKQGRRALLKIDAAVLEAYALQSELEDELLRRFSGMKRSHLPFSFDSYDPQEWADAKAELADDREASRIAEEFSALLQKRNLFGLSSAEQEEYERLQSQREARRSQYRTLVTAGD